MAGTQLTQTTAEVAKHATLNETLLPWFDKININTLVWQVIALIIIFYFGNTIKELLDKIVKKLLSIKKTPWAEFDDFSEETKETIGTNDKKLKEEIEPYKIAIEQDPNLVFLNQFIEFEGALYKLWANNFPNAVDFMKPNPNKMLNDLIQSEKLDSQAISIYYDIRSARNKIVHGNKILTDTDEAKPYIQAVFLLKNLVISALEGGKK